MATDKDYLQDIILEMMQSNEHMIKLDKSAILSNSYLNDINANAWSSFEQLNTIAEILSNKSESEIDKENNQSENTDIFKSIQLNTYNIFDRLEWLTRFITKSSSRSLWEAQEQKNMQERMLKALSKDGGDDKNGKSTKAKGDKGGLGIFGIFGMIGSALMTMFSFIFEPKSILSFAKTIAGNLLKLFGKFSWILLIAGLFNGITDGWNEWKKTGNLKEALIKGLTGFLKVLSFGLIDEKTVRESLDKITKWFDEIWISVKNFFSDPKAAISKWWAETTGEGGLLTTIFASLESAWVWIKETFSDFKESLTKKWQELIQDPDGIVGKIFSVFKGVKEWIELIFKNPIEGLTVLWNNLFQKGGFYDLLFVPINAVIDWVGKKFGWIDKDAPEFNLGDILRDWFDSMLEWLAKKSDFVIPGSGNNLRKLKFNPGEMPNADEQVLAANKSATENDNAANTFSGFDETGSSPNTTSLSQVQADYAKAKNKAANGAGGANASVNSKSTNTINSSNSNQNVNIFPSPHIDRTDNSVFAW